MHVAAPAHGSNWHIAALDVCDGVSAAGESGRAGELRPDRSGAGDCCNDNIAMCAGGDDIPDPHGKKARVFRASSDRSASTGPPPATLREFRRSPDERRAGRAPAPARRMAGALLDRLTHHVHILQMNGDSYRLNQSKRRSRGASSDTSVDNPTQA